MQRVCAIALGSFCGIAVFPIVWGLGGSRPIAIAVALAATLAVALWTSHHPALQLETSAVPRSFKWVAAIAAVIALLQLGRLTVFMVDPAEVRYSNFPSNVWEVQHSCLTAYFCAVEAVDKTPNVYDESLYELPGKPNEPRRGRMIGAFKIDQYEYPPTFLLLPRVLHAIAPTFLAHRALWFGLNLLVLMGAMLLAARFMSAAAATRAIVLLPLIFVAFPTLSMLQKGNIQGMVIALAVIAMLWLERGKHAAGGAILAYTIVSKLYPGLLLVYLVVRKQWSALAWTAGFGALYLSVSIADVGIEPYRAFLHHLPRLLSGEAFPAFRNPAALAVNLSIPGLAFKLKLFDVPGMGFGAAKLIGWIYTAIALWLTVLFAKGARTDQDKLIVILSIIILATLRSPFLPTAYATFPALWLLTLMSAALSPSARALVITLAAWALLTLYVPSQWMQPRPLAILTLLPQFTMIALPILVLARLKLATPGVSRDMPRLQPTTA
jgi:alpha-1,2-mannosyltransferase